MRNAKKRANSRQTSLGLTVAGFGAGVSVSGEVNGGWALTASEVLAQVCQHGKNNGGAVH